MRVAVEADDAAVELAAVIRGFLRSGDGRADRGILVCGSGVGMTIAANKVPGIRAAQCHDELTAEHARTSNDAQILVLGARSVGPDTATRVVAAWLGAEFQESPRRAGKMAKLRAIEERYLG